MQIGLIKPRRTLLIAVQIGLMNADTKNTEEIYLPDRALSTGYRSAVCNLPIYQLTHLPITRGSFLALLLAAGKLFLGPRHDCAFNFVMPVPVRRDSHHV